MTPEQKRRRIAEIERDVQQIMHQLHGIEWKVDSQLQPRPRIMEQVKLPTIKTPSVFKKIWIGFKQEMSQQKSP